MEHISNALTSRMRRIARGPTQAELKLLEAAADIVMVPATIEDACYTHAVLCQLGMPRKKTPERRFERTSGRASLLMTAGEIWNGLSWIPQALPYGPKPRVVLVNLTSTAVRTGSRFVDVGRSTHDFMKRVGLDTQGSEYRSLRRQLAALSVCRMQLGGWAGGRAINMPDNQPIRKFDVWIVPDGNQQTLWPETVELSQEYFESVKEHAVPLDERAVAGLRGTALGLDVYTWLAHRLLRVKNPAGDLVPWVPLKQQFGQEYARLKDFRQEFRSVLRQVLQLYHGAKVEEVPTGLRLKQSHPPVPAAKVFLR